MEKTMRSSGGRLKVVLVLGALLLFGGATLPAQATPTVLGPTGLMFVPTADVLPNGGFNFALNRAWETNYLTFNMSLIDNLEFGVTALSGDGWSDTLANLKFRLMPETKTGPAVAVGVNDLADDDGRDAYVSLTKNLASVGFRGTIGLGSDGLLAGISKELNAVSISKSGRGGAPGVTFMAELYDDDLNVGVNIGLSPELRAHVYLYDLNEAVLGLSYQARF